MIGKGSGPHPPGLPALSGLLVALSFPPLHTLVLPFFALVPLAVWVARLPPGAAGARASARGGALLGAVCFGLIFHWVPVALVVAEPGVGSAVFAVTAFALIVAGLAAMTAVSVRLLHHAVVLGAPLWLALAVTWTALEWSRAHLPDSLALPWLGLGTSLTAYPELVGIAEIVGARGVTFWLACVNGLLAILWLRRAEGPERSDGGRAGGPTALLAGCIALVVGAPAAWGVWRASTLETRAVADVAVIQPNVEGRAKVPSEPGRLVDPAARLPSPGAILGGRAAEGPEGAEVGERAARPGGADPPEASAGRPPDLVVLPELFIRAVPGSPEASAAVDRLQSYSARVGAPVLFGALGADGPVRYNSAFLMTSDGLSDFRYDKHRLVPLVERVPFRFPSGEVSPGSGDGVAPGSRDGVAPRSGDGSPGSGGYGRGAGWPLAEAAGVRYGILICYESSYPEVARGLRRAGADVLVNLTNDAWFGAEPWYARTTALWQHPAHLVMRAIESRVGVVRSANTGISLFVDPVGRTHQVTGLFVEDARHEEVRTTDVITVHTRYGDLAGSVSALVALGLLLTAVWGRGRRRPRGLGEGGPEP